MSRAVALAACLLALGGCGIFTHATPPPPGGPRVPPAPHVTPGELDARTLLGELPARAARLGAGAPSLVTSAEATENEWVGGFVDVPRDDCLLGYARGSSSIEDVDVAIYSDEGAQLAVDEGRDVHPTVLLCAPHPDRVYVTAHVVEGEGLVVVGAQLVPKERALIVGRGLGARGSVAEGPRPADAWPGLEEAVRVHRLALGGSWEEFKRVALTVDARLPTFVSLPIDADQCVDAVIVPDEDVALLDVEALDGEGRVVARAREGLGARSLTVCSPLSMPGSLSVRPHVGRGLTAVVLARAKGEVARDLSIRPDVVWAAAAQPIDAAKGARDTLLAKSGYQAAVATTNGSLALGRRVTVPLDLKGLGGACARIDVIAGAPLGLIDARVWDDAGALLASGESSASLALFACVRSTARLELETRGRPGPFAVTVRPERWKDAAFAAHPLAASRMLARAAAGPNMLLEGRGAPVRSVALDPATGTSWTESVAAGRCVRVTVGAQGDGAGVDVRASDADGSDLDRSESAYAASVRACAPADAARSVHFDVRASAGHVDALIGEQTSQVSAN
ncbi:MAG TPA: hypothetical protein VIF15_01035 [Polyangiaceae bacterium]